MRYRILQRSHKVTSISEDLLGEETLTPGCIIRFRS